MLHIFVKNMIKQEKMMNKKDELLFMIITILLLSLMFIPLFWH